MTEAQMEKAAKNHMSAYAKSAYYNLHFVYGRFSEAKARAWKYCERTCSEMNGFDLKVITYNSEIFTAGFMFQHPETGVLCFYYITPSYDVFVEWDS